MLYARIGGRILDTELPLAIVDIARITLGGNAELPAVVLVRSVVCRILHRHRRRTILGVLGTLFVVEREDGADEHDDDRNDEQPHAGAIAQLEERAVP